jgi:decaprenyl-phosphate phosphoribosyltransferase
LVTLAYLKRKIAIIHLLRPHQYVKNVFVFAPLLFSFTFEENKILRSIEAFFLFSLVASGIYVFNDLMDIAEDQNHPSKKNRPIASGKVSKRTAIILIFIFVLPGLAVALYLNSDLFIVLASYFVLNILYSVKLKHIAIIDITIISLGFVLRLFAGSTVTDIKLSVWIITITFLLALFIALGKRRDDVILHNKGQKARKSIDGYNLEFINIAMTMMAGVVIVSYMLYSISAEVMIKMHEENLYLTTIFVILGILRYMQLTFVEEKSGAPTRIVINDTFLKIIITAWVFSFLGLGIL